MRSKKVFSLFLLLVFLLSFNVVSAENVEEFSSSDGENYYTVSVPSELSPGDTGEVIVKGHWDSQTTLILEVSDSVELRNSITDELGVVLSVEFEKLELLGNDNDELIEHISDIYVEDLEDNILFGTWNGFITYNVSLEQSNVKIEMVNESDVEKEIEENLEESDEKSEVSPEDKVEESIDNKVVEGEEQEENITVDENATVENEENSVEESKQDIVVEDSNIIDNKEDIDVENTENSDENVVEEPKLDIEVSTENEDTTVEKEDTTTEEQEEVVEDNTVEDKDGIDVSDEEVVEKTEDTDILEDSSEEEKSVVEETEKSDSEVNQEGEESSSDVKNNYKEVVKEPLVEEKSDVVVKVIYSIKQWNI